MLGAALILLAAAQPCDLLLRGGRVLDPGNGIDGVRDVAIADGAIAAFAERLDAGEARRVVDARGLLVVPGLVDLHAHMFFGTEPNADYSNGYNAVPPDGFTFRSCVTTVVDTGGSGWRNFSQFKEQVRAAASSAARAFRRSDIGHLAVGAGADIAVLRVLEGDFGFVDVEGARNRGSTKLTCELTLRGGKVVRDLNGISASLPR
jgi:predicted amidohydrolase